MPAKGSGAGRVKGGPQLVTRLASEDEKSRVDGYARSVQVPAGELVRQALNAFEPRLRLATDKPPIKR